MKDPKKRYGSPYDPKFSGKIQRPEKREREERQANIRGCGDPNCTMCNPETAGRGLRGPDNMSRSPFDLPSFSVESARNPSDYERLSNSMLEEIAKRMGRSTDELREMALRGYVNIATDGSQVDINMPPNGWNSRSSVKPSGPPQAYKQAREAVEAWLSKAPEQTFDDIIGNDEALAQLKDAITAPVEHKELYEAYNMKMPKGALLSGPPGCGKTMFARAAASEMKRLYGDSQEFISISGSELQSMYVGETEGRIKAIFDFAREYKAYHGYPLLVFMDEAEVLLPDRTGRVRRLASWEESQVATFLAEMDGIQESGAFVLLATNRPEVIDQAVLRDGRCDFKIVVQKPTREAVEVILRKNFDGVLLHEYGSDNVLDELIFAATEAFYDPHKVIVEAKALKLDTEGKVHDTKGKNFCLEHIVSGAMAASLPARAKRYAFNRDKAEGKAKGVVLDDVLRSVNDLFEENKGLEHSFALESFKDEFVEELNAENKAGNQSNPRLN